MKFKYRSRQSMIFERQRITHSPDLIVSIRMCIVVLEKAPSLFVESMTKDERKLHSGIGQQFESGCDEARDLEGENTPRETERVSQQHFVVALKLHVIIEAQALFETFHNVNVEK